jgi:hypothetical protein
MTLEEQRQERLEEQRADRALALLSSPLFWCFVHALDVIGWKIVRQDGDGMRWQVNSRRKNWPSWIDNISSWGHEKASPKLQLLDGGKHDDDERD